SRMSRDVSRFLLVVSRSQARLRARNDNQLQSLRGAAPTENVRSIRITFPSRSFTDTMSLPLGNAVTGLSSTHSQTPCDFGLTFAARFPPAGTPPSGKSAVTVNVFGSMPV